MSVWMDGPWMLDDAPEPPPGERALVRSWREGGQLTRDLADLLEACPSGLSCDELAERLRRRRADVLDALRSDGRFEHHGRTVGSRWRLAQGIAVEALQDGTGRNDPSSLDSGLPPDGRSA